MTIIAAYVPGPLGDEVLATAISEAKIRKAHLLVLNLSAGAALVDDHVASANEIETIQAKIDSQHLSGQVLRQESDTDVATAIVAAAAETKAELVIIGVRRRTATGKLIFGSSAQRVILEAECPVLSVKTPKHVHG